MRNRDTYSCPDLLADRVVLGDLLTFPSEHNHPDLFRTFVTSSTSIWWNERSVLEDEPSFVCKIQTGEAAPRVLISVGFKGQDAPDRPLPGMTREQMETMMSQ